MSLSLSDAIQQFDDAHIGEIADTTRDWYAFRFRGLVEYFGPDRPVDSIGSADLRAWRRHLTERDTKWGDQRPMVHEPLSEATIAGYIRACKRLFKWLVSEGELDQSPAVVLKQATRKRPEPRAIDEADYQKMLQVAQETSVRDLAVVLFLADTGCRLQGIANLRLKDIRLDENRQRGSAIVTEKGTRARRVHFGQTTFRAIVAYLMVRPEVDDENLFIGKFGPLSSSGIYQILKRLAKKAGITGRFNPHSFRHRFARTVLQNGGNLPALARMLGHVDPAVTARYYALFSDSELEQWHEIADPATPVRKPRKQQRI